MKNVALGLMEIGTEELPALLLKNIATNFKHYVEQGLLAAQLNHSDIRWFATPRRIALLIDNLVSQQPEQHIERIGPTVQAAFDSAGTPTAAGLGFARACEVGIKNLQQKETEKGVCLYYQAQQPGQSLDVLLPAILSKALQQLPLPKTMHWDNQTTSFIRPVRWVVLMHGNRVIETKLFDLTTQNISYGHRFHYPQAISLNHANEYLHKLQQAYVLADFAARRTLIQQYLQTLAEQQQAEAVWDENLLDEVTGLVEWPVALLGQFDAAFLKVPQEALMASMRNHQKVFALKDQQGKLKSQFIIIANIESHDSAQVIAGNERVIKARLSDAHFFYQQDCQHRSVKRLEKLKTVVFQQKLGTLYDKTQRIVAHAKLLADMLQSDSAITERAALLCKTDLMSDMVNEFPELQGTMGYYYALHEGEGEDIADAIRMHYCPRFAGDTLPTHLSACCVALADKIDTLLGIFGIGQKPTGDKDPFGLRRAALGMVRVIIEKNLSLDLRTLLTSCLTHFRDLAPQKLLADTADNVLQFILERALYSFDDTTSRGDAWQAALAATASHQKIDLHDIYQRAQALIQFTTSTHSDALIAANKRVRNLLKDVAELQSNALQSHLLEHVAEQQLATALAQTQATVIPLLQANSYTEALETLAQLRTSIDNFFNDVMVMVDDQALRQNRLCLLLQIRQLFLQIADLSLLNTGTR